MHSPVSTQAFAHLRAASGPSPVRRMSMTPAMTARGSASTPPAPVTGQTSTHLPQRVHASAIAATRADSAVSKLSVMPPRGLPPRDYRVRAMGGSRASPRTCWLVGGGRLVAYQAERGGGRDRPPPPNRSARSNLRSDPSERIVPNRGHYDVIVGRRIA